MYTSGEWLIGWLTGLLTGGVLPIALYFAKRWWEGTSDSEALIKANSALDFKTKLRKLGLSETDISPNINEVTERLLKKEEKQKEIAVQVIAEATGNGKIITQAEMTNYAVRAAAVADAKMKLAFAGLLQELDDDLKFRYEEAQRAWHKFADKQSAAAAAHVEGGSLQPLIRASEYESLAVDRAAALEIMTRGISQSEK